MQDINPNELTGWEEHLASLPDDSRYDGYDRGDLDYQDRDDEDEFDGGPGLLRLALNLETVASHILWERNNPNPRTPAEEDDILF